MKERTWQILLFGLFFINGMKIEMFLMLKFICEYMDDDYLFVLEVNSEHVSGRHFHFIPNSRNV